MPDPSAKEFWILSDPILVDYSQFLEVEKYQLFDIYGKKNQDGGDEDDKKQRNIRSQKGQSAYILYSNTDDSKRYGLLDRDYIIQVQKFEQYIQQYNQVSTNFDEGVSYSLPFKWTDMCYAGYIPVS